MPTGHRAGSVVTGGAAGAAGAGDGAADATRVNSEGSEARTRFFNMGQVNAIFFKISYRNVFQNKAITGIIYGNAIFGITRILNDHSIARADELNARFIHNNCLIVCTRFNLNDKTRACCIHSSLYRLTSMNDQIRSSFCRSNVPDCRS